MSSKPHMYKTVADQFKIKEKEKKNVWLFFGFCSLLILGLKTILSVVEGYSVLVVSE